MVLLQGASARNSSGPQSCHHMSLGLIFTGLKSCALTRDTLVWPIQRLTSHSVDFITDVAAS